MTADPLFTDEEKMKLLKDYGDCLDAMSKAKQARDLLLTLSKNAVFFASADTDAVDDALTMLFTAQHELGTRFRILYAEIKQALAVPEPPFDPNAIPF